MKIVEMKGTSHVYTLNDGTTFRIYARKTAKVADELVSDEMRRAEKLRILRFIKTANSQPAPMPFVGNGEATLTTPSEPVAETPTMNESITTNTDEGVAAVQSEEVTATTTSTKKKKLSSKATTTDEGSEK